MKDYWTTFTAWLHNVPTTLTTLRWVDVWDYRTAFNSIPPEIWRFREAYITFLVVCFIGGVITLLHRKLYAPYRAVLLQFFWTESLVSLLLFFLRQQQVPTLGMDFLRTLQFCATLIWFGLILRYRLTAYRRDRLMILVEERKQKYLPRSKTAA